MAHGRGCRPRPDVRMPGTDGRKLGRFGLRLPHRRIVARSAPPRGVASQSADGGACAVRRAPVGQRPGPRALGAVVGWYAPLLATRSSHLDRGL